MDGELKRKIFSEIDSYVIGLQMSHAEIKIAEVIKPQLEKFSKEYEVDMIDLFVAYMDHVAKSSKSMSAGDAGVDLDLTKDNMKLY